MAFEDKHLDVLQNIEFAIVSVYHEHNDLNDYEVMKALDALIDHYRLESHGHTSKENHLPPNETLVIQRVQEMCEHRLGRKDLGRMKMDPSGVKTVEEILSCLRKIRKSVDRWNKQGGKQGYLRFVKEFVK
ncbi:MAG: hypothetical protein V1799_20565 [bacterium]